MFQKFPGVAVRGDRGTELPPGPHFSLFRCFLTRPGELREWSCCERQKRADAKLSRACLDQLLDSVRISETRHTGAVVQFCLGNGCPREGPRRVGTSTVQERKFKSLGARRAEHDGDIDDVVNVPVQSKPSSFQC